MIQIRVENDKIEVEFPDTTMFCFFMQGGWSFGTAVLMTYQPWSKTLFNWTKMLPDEIATLAEDILIFAKQHKLEIFIS